MAVRLVAPKVGAIRRERHERERKRDKSIAGLPSSVVKSHIMRMKFQNCSRLDTGVVIDTKEVR